MIKKASILLLCFLYCCYGYSKESIVITAPNSIWAQAQGTKIQGPIIEIANSIFTELDISVDTKVLPWARALHNLRDGKLDGMLVLNRTKDRDQYVEYSIAYADIPVSIFVPKGRSFTFSSLDDLVGKKGLFVQGQQFGNQFETFKPQLTLRAITTPGQMVKMISKSRADYAIANKYAFIMEAKRLALVDEFDTLPRIISLTPIHIGLSKKSKFTKYLNEINIRIQKMKDEGVFQRVIDDAIKK